MKGQILLKALEILKTGVMNQVDFFEAVLASGYGANMGKIDYKYRKIQQTKRQKKYIEDDLEKRKRRLQVFISKMKHSGLIKKVDHNNLKIKISEKGREKIRKLKNKLPNRRYKKEGRGQTVIISFDIPEKLRRKRNWLREVIRNFGFEMVHQSVWIGKTKIPENFIKDIEDLKILEYVEIFEISKIGTLKKL